MERLWTPWRQSYVTSDATPLEEAKGSIFERLAAEQNDEANFIVLRAAHAFVIMNLFPYNTGHLMIVPYRRVAAMEELTADEWAGIGDLLQRVTRAIQSTLKPDGLNIGMNVGAAAGAGIPDHLHLHVVPRWTGDTNFMPVLGATKVLPELLPDTYRRLRAALAEEQAAPSTSTLVVGATAAGALVSQAAASAAVPDPVPDSYGMVAPHAEHEFSTVDSSFDRSHAEQTDALVADEPPAGPPETDEETAGEAASLAVAAGLANDDGGDATTVTTLEPGQAAAESTAVDAGVETAPPIVRQAGAVVFVRDKIALRLAKDQTWVLPKGHVEAGESLEETARREVGEEMGLAGRITGQVGDDTFIFKGRQRHVTYFVFLADRRLPSWADHFGRDTFLYSPAEAQRRLTHPNAQAILNRALAMAHV